MSLPTETAAMQMAKGELLEMVDDINRVGQVAYRDQAAVATLFNRNLLTRARRQRRKAADSKDPAAEEETE